MVSINGFSGRYIVGVMVFFLISVIILGCSSLNDNFPEGSDVNQSDTGSTRYEPGRATLGYYQLLIDYGKLSSELIPIRNVLSYDTIEAIDITNFLLLEPCTECVKIKSIALDPGGNIKLSIGIRHPFPAGDPTRPITGRNRADLLVYNVEGVISADSHENYSFPAIGATCASPFLLNADGYTNYLDNSLDEIFPTSTDLHPYILHFADYSGGNYDPIANPQTGYPFPNPQTIPPTIPHGKLVMAQGSDFDYRDYIFNPGSGGQLEFLLTVLGTYGVAATRTERFTPACRVPQHQKKAASEVFAYPLHGDGLIAGDEASTVDLRIEVVDPGHGAPVGSGLNQVEFPSDVKTIVVEIPGIMQGSVVINNPSPVFGDGSSPASPLAYEITVNNELGASAGKYFGLVKVEDSYPVGTNDPVLLESKDAIHRVPPGTSPLDGLADLGDISTFYMFKIDVNEETACASNYQRIDEKTISQDVNILAGIDERSVYASGEDVYVAYKKSVSPGGCPWPVGQDLRQVRCMVSHNSGATFSDYAVSSTFCESPVIDSQTLCIAGKPSGVILVAWNDATGINVYASNDGGQTFPLVSVVDESGSIEWRPAIAIDSLDRVLVAWINQKQSIITIRNDFSVKYAKGNLSLVFSAPQSISDDLIYKAFSFSGDIDCDLASDSNGGVVAVWTDADGQDDPLSGAIACDRFNGTSFGSDRIVSGSETGLNGRNPSVAVGPDDEIHVAWHVQGNPGNIYVSHGSITGGFSAPESASTVPNSPLSVRPCIDVHSSGALHVLFPSRNPVSGHDDVISAWKCPDDSGYSTLRINYSVYPPGTLRPIGSLAFLADGTVCAIWVTNESSGSENGELRLARFSD